MKIKTQSSANRIPMRLRDNSFNRYSIQHGQGEQNNRRLEEKSD